MSLITPMSLKTQSDWSIIAEIWQHINSKNPSDESGIVRVGDDFGR